MTDIEWARNRDGTKGKVWNPTVGCSRASAGCERCYAERFAHRGLSERHRGLTVMGNHGPRWTGDVRTIPEALEAPLHWRKAQVVFVNSMSDLFHERVPIEYIAAVFGVMAATPQHTYVILTKRDPRKWFEWLGKLAKTEPGKIITCLDSAIHTVPLTTKLSLGDLQVERWPLTNVVLGVSCENQEQANRRIPWILQTPAVTRVVSLEPLLGPIDLTDVASGPDGEVRNNCLKIDTWEKPDWTGLRMKHLDGVIVGGESGSGARPCNIDWIRDIVRQCREVQTKCFVKQLGARPVIANDSPLLEGWDYPLDMDYFNGQHDQGDEMPLRFQNRKGADMSEWPSDLRVRELPW